jgi:hypothetical protein
MDRKPAPRAEIGLIQRVVRNRSWFGFEEDFFCHTDFVGTPEDSGPEQNFQFDRRIANVNLSPDQAIAYSRNLKFDFTRRYVAQIKFAVIVRARFDVQFPYCNGRLCDRLAGSRIDYTAVQSNSEKKNQEMHTLLNHFDECGGWGLSRRNTSLPSLGSAIRIQQFRNFAM